MFALAGIEAAPDTDRLCTTFLRFSKGGEMCFEKSCQRRNFLERGSPVRGFIAFHLSYVRRLEANAASVLL
jgi:hypothetical protein